MAAPVTAATMDAMRRPQIAQVAAISAFEASEGRSAGPMKVGGRARAQAAMLQGIHFQAFDAYPRSTNHWASGIDTSRNSTVAATYDV